MRLNNVQFLLVSPQAELASAWGTAFQGLANFKVSPGKFQDVIEPWKFIVSPGNSYGIMDGGIDQQYLDYFGDELQFKVQDRILSHYYGEQPVGTAFIIPARTSPNYVMLVHAPTMRYPMELVGTLQENVFWAARAAFVELADYPNGSEAVPRVLMPGLGTGAGHVPCAVAAQLMRLAWDNVQASNDRHLTWEDATRTHIRLRQIMKVDF
jgi:O-acetyl-ADP-ribose deacetylase (regulator of RNase III)